MSLTYSQEYYQKNRAMVLAKHKAKYASKTPTQRAKHPAKSKAWQRADPEATRKIARKTRKLPEPTNCECCGREQPERALSLDHCHSTGKFRGWLCHLCNTGVGALGDNIAGVTKALAYLHHFELQE